MASCERTVILEHNRQSLDFREEISTMGTGHLWWSAIGSLLWKDNEILWKLRRCHEMSCQFGNLNYQRLTIFATSTHKDRLLHDSDFVFKISAIGIVFFPGHWFDPLVWPSRITRVNGSKRNVSWIWTLWVTLLNVSMLTWSASFFSRKCIDFVEAKLKPRLNSFVPKPFRQGTTWAFWRPGWHFTRNPDGFPALLSWWFSFSFLRRPDFGAGVPGYLVCAPGMKLRWFGQTTWVVSLDWRKTTPKFEGIEDLWMRFWRINGSYW